MIPSNSEQSAVTTSRLMEAVSLGAFDLKHRVVMPPLTRSRSTWPGSIPNDLMALYYEQRASDGGLIIGEATNISQLGTGWFGSPGLYTEAQVEGWKKILGKVHEKGTVMVAQLWHTGRASHLSMHEPLAPVSASVNPSYWQLETQLVSTPGGWIHPSPHRALSLPEIKSIVEDYAAAAKRAQQAGFDGVELHAANGYLIDQFLQDGSNQRQDEYGGSIENRLRLLCEVVEALQSVWPSNRVGVRIAPGSIFNQMHDSDAVKLFTAVARRLSDYDLAYLHVVEPRIRGKALHEGDSLETGRLASHMIRLAYSGKLIANGGFTPESAETIIREGGADAVSFGKYFISNPDLPRRIREGIALSEYDRDSFYTFDAKGYTDYPPAGSLVGADASS
jgi:N-ethylmaleimide reductase